MKTDYEKNVHVLTKNFLVRVLCPSVFHSIFYVVCLKRTDQGLREIFSYQQSNTNLLVLLGKVLSYLAPLLRVITVTTPQHFYTSRHS